jgi:hypothetical protein
MPLCLVNHNLKEMLEMMLMEIFEGGGSSNNVDGIGTSVAGTVK